MRSNPEGVVSAGRAGGIPPPGGIAPGAHRPRRRLPLRDATPLGLCGGGTVSPGSGGYAATRGYGTEPRWGSQRAKRSGNPTHARPSRPRTCKQKTRFLPGMLRQWDGTPLGFATHQALWQSDARSPIPATHVQAKNTFFAWHVTPMGRNPVGVRNAPSALAIRRMLAHPGHARASKKHVFCLACYATGMLRHGLRPVRFSLHFLFGSIASVPAVPAATATGRASRPRRSRGC